MAKRGRRERGAASYSFGFAGAAMLLVAATLVLVLYVLPQRYVLSSGFMEGTLALPDPRTPFEPTSPLVVAALPPRTGSIEPGPAETFWSEVLPLIEAERFTAAIPPFAAYLEAYPGDVGARREYAVTLSAAGLADRAIPVLEGLLARNDDRDLRRLLARMLRDEGRLDEASLHYRSLVAGTPSDVELTLEWARALSWVEDYPGAERVIRSGLSHNPDSAALRIELARMHYYVGRLEEAEAILAGLPEAELRAYTAEQLRTDVVAALTPPEAPPEEPAAPPTLLEQAARAREEGDLSRAAELYEASLREHPEDGAGWQAYADFLQYELNDFAGALVALGHVERLTGGYDAGLQYRMARLEVWTDRTDEARLRLETLAAGLGPEPAEEAPLARADVHALLGDLHRWDGARFPAVHRYELALEDEPDHERAVEGFAVLRAEVDRMIAEVEIPRAGATAASWADSDDYRRFDGGGEWFGVDDDLVWGTRGGSRWIEGVDLAGATAQRQGFVADLEGARWWRWGTVRTGAHVGFQSLRTGSVDLSAGVSARFVDGAGRRTEIGVDHAPAYALTNTLQASSADVRYERLSASHQQALGERWSVAVSGEGVSFDHRGLPGTDRNLRVAAGASLGRTLSRRLTLGLAGRALHYLDASPVASGRSLYWDPDMSLALGPYAQLSRPIGSWDLTARLNPAIGWIDERGDGGGAAVPDLSGRIGALYDGRRYRASVEVFYGQGRFTGYRSYGMDLSFSARGWFDGVATGQPR